MRALQDYFRIARNPRPERDFCQKARAYLLRSEGLHGFDRGGAAGGNEAGDDRGEEQQKCDGSEDGKIELSDSVECALHTAADEVGSDEANGEADACENQAFTDDKGNDTAAVCTERHAQGDLVRALRYGEGHDAVDTECGQEEARRRRS